jgi:O-antigen/teichoic acid export membrane protein
VTFRRLTARLRQSAFILAIWERVAYRGASAITVFAIALFGDPSEMGAYGTGVVALLLFQSLTDLALRQAGVVVVGNGRYVERQIRRVAWIGAAGAAGATAATLLALLGPGGSLLLTLPLSLAPLAVAPAILRLVQLQRTGAWPTIARAQSISATASLLLCLPLIKLSPLLAAAAQTFVVEAGFTCMVFQISGRRKLSLSASHVRGDLRHHFVPTAVSNGIAWGQSQGERATLSLIGARNALGLYTLANSLTRTIQDAIVLGIVNYLRPLLAQQSNDAERVRELTRVMRLSMFVAFGVQAVTWAAATTVLPPLLSESWDPALHLVPVLSACLLAPALIAPTTAALLQLGLSRVLITSQLSGCLLSIVTGLTLAHSMTAGAATIFMKDAILLTQRLYCLRNYRIARDLRSIIAGMSVEAIIISALICWR